MQSHDLDFVSSLRGPTSLATSGDRLVRATVCQCFHPGEGGGRRTGNQSSSLRSPEVHTNRIKGERVFFLPPGLGWVGLFEDLSILLVLHNSGSDDVTANLFSSKWSTCLEKISVRNGSAQVG
jgi:hypothetical protein